MSLPVVQTINTTANRRMAKYSSLEQVRRITWWFICPLFRFSPRPMFRWRNFILRIMGARIGSGTRIYGSVRVYFPWKLEMGKYCSVGEHALIYNLGPVTLGDHVTVSQRAHLCAGTHDYQSPEMRLLRPPIHVAGKVWICADAFICPGVTVHEGAVVAARAVVVKDVEPWAVVGGNPARFIKKREMTNQ